MRWFRVLIFTLLLPGILFSRRAQAQPDDPPAEPSPAPAVQPRLVVFEAFTRLG